MVAGAATTASNLCPAPLASAAEAVPVVMFVDGTKQIIPTGPTRRVPPTSVAVPTTTCLGFSASGSPLLKVSAS